MSWTDSYMELLDGYDSGGPETRSIIRLTVQRMAHEADQWKAHLQEWKAYSDRFDKELYRELNDASTSEKG